MSRRSWMLAALAVFGAGGAGCSHAPEVNDASLTQLSATQLTDVHAGEAGVVSAQRALARQEKERDDAQREMDQARDQRGQLKDAIDAKDQEIQARKKEKEKLEAQLEVANAHVDAADARIEWVKARIASAQAELAHQQALVEQAKYQALVKAKDPAAQGLKAEDFAERVRKTAQRAQDAKADAAEAQQRYEKEQSSWQNQAQKD